MTKEELLKYLQKLTFQAAVEYSYNQNPSSFNDPMLQDLRYMVNDFDKNLYPEYRKQKQLQQNSQQIPNSDFSLVSTQNNLMKPLQNTATNIMQATNQPLSNLSMPLVNNMQKNSFGNVTQTNKQNNLLTQKNTETTKPLSQYEVQQKVQQQDQTQKPFWDKYKDLNLGTAMQKVGSKAPIPKPAFQYYGISTKMADGEPPTAKAKEENIFYKLDDIKNQATKDDYINKAAQMFGLDKNDPDLYEKVKNTRVVVPRVNSTLYDDIKNSEVTQKKIAEQYKILKENANDKLDTGLEYNLDGKPFSREGGLYYTINKADMKRTRINKDGSFDISVDDGYDFEYNNKDVKLLDTPLEFFGKIINNNAYEQQQKGKLENYILSAPIHYSKEELEEILRKYGLL